MEHEIPLYSYDGQLIQWIDQKLSDYRGTKYCLRALATSEFAPWPSSFEKACAENN